MERPLPPAGRQVDRHQTMRGHLWPHRSRHPGRPAPGEAPTGPSGPGAAGPPPGTLGHPVWTRFSLFPRLSTPPRNTTSLRGPMLVHLRHKTQKQIKRQFLFKQERGQASGIPGQRPFGSDSWGPLPPTGSGGIKAKACMWLAPAAIDSAFNFLCFSSPNVCSDLRPFYQDSGNKMQNPRRDQRPSGARLTPDKRTEKRPARAARALSPSL